MTQAVRQAPKKQALSFPQLQKLKRLHSNYTNMLQSLFNWNYVMGSNATFILPQLTSEEEVRGLRNILFKNRLEEAVGVIASLSGDSVTPGENFLSLVKLNPNMAQDNMVKVLSLLYSHSLSHAFSPWQFLSPLKNKNWHSTPIENIHYKIDLITRPTLRAYILTDMPFHPIYEQCICVCRNPLSWEK